MAESKEEVNFSLGNTYPMGLVPIGSTGTIERVEGEGRLRRRIFDMGLTPNTEIFVRKRAPLGDPLEITIRGYELTLRKEEAMNVLVKLTSLPSLNPKGENYAQER